MLKKQLLIGLTLMLLISFGVVSCIGPSSPGEVAKAFLRAANDGKYSVAEKYISSRTLKEYKELFGKAVIREQMDYLTRNGTIERIEVAKEEIKNGISSVYLSIYYRGGKQAKGNLHLIKEQGAWKIVAF